ncbi:MAG: GAF domain-containing protein, partial [Acidimicrobiales bacterium]
MSDEAGALDAAVTRISTQLVAASGDELLDVIRAAMAELGGVFDVDHAYVALLDVEPGGPESPLVLEWISSEVPRPSDIFGSFTPTEQRWWLDRLLTEGSFVFQSVDEPRIGQDAAARLRGLGVRSLVLVPILVGGRLHGHLGLS